MRVTILYKHDEKSTLSVIRSKSKTSCTPTLIYQNKKPLSHYASVILDQYQNKEPHTPSIYNNKLKKQIKKVFCKLAKHDDQVYFLLLLEYELQTQQKVLIVFMFKEMDIK